MKSNSPVAMTPIKMKESCGVLINAWDHLAKSQIDKVWSLALHGRENGENEDV